MGLFGWEVVDPLTTRLVASALMGIGLESYLCRNAGVDVYRTMLKLKIFWSVAANIAIAIAIIQGAPKGAWIFQAIFLPFSAVWIYWHLNLQKAQRK